LLSELFYNDIKIGNVHVSIYRKEENMLKKIKEKCKVGYSGHEIGTTDVSVPAVMVGATSIERHFTLNRTWYGYDQAASLEPAGLFRLVNFIRVLDKIMGDGKK